MRETAWVVFLAVLVVFVLLVAIEVGRRSSLRSPIDLAANLFTRTDVRNEAPAAPTPGPGGNNGEMDLAS